MALPAAYAYISLRAVVKDEVIHNVTATLALGVALVVSGIASDGICGVILHTVQGLTCAEIQVCSGLPRDVRAKCRLLELSHGYGRGA